MGEVGLCLTEINQLGGSSGISLFVFGVSSGLAHKKAWRWNVLHQTHKKMDVYIHVESWTEDGWLTTIILSANLVS